MQARNLNKYEFPYSENGPKMKHRVNVLFALWAVLIGCVAGLYLFVGMQGWQSTPPANQAYLEKQLAKQSHSGASASNSSDAFDRVLGMLGLSDVIGDQADQRTVDQKKAPTNALNNPNKNAAPTDASQGATGVTSVSAAPEMKQQLARLKSYQHYQVVDGFARSIKHVANFIMLLLIIQLGLYLTNVIKRQRWAWATISGLAQSP